MFRLEILSVLHLVNMCIHILVFPPNILHVFFTLLVSLLEL